MIGISTRVDEDIALGEGVWGVFVRADESTQIEWINTRSWEQMWRDILMIKTEYAKTATKCYICAAIVEFRE
jgi:hypothetical protein